MKKFVIFAVVIMLMLCNTLNANVIDGIKIDRVGTSDTFTVSFLYNTYIENETDWWAWWYYDIMISAEPIGQFDPITERCFTPGEILVGTATPSGDGIQYVGEYGNLYLGGYDWTASDAPYQAVQITASDNGGAIWPINTPLFSFTYNGSSTEFVIYNSIESQEVEAGRIPVPPVPEPATMSLLALGFLGLIRRK